MKIVCKTYKYKLKLNSSQKEKFTQWLNTTRLIYNLAKARKEYVYESTKTSLSAYDLQKEVVQLKKEFDWMKELPKDTLNEPLFRLEHSFKMFFKKKNNYPKWAKKKNWNSLHFIQQNKNGLRIEDGKIKLHKRIYLRYFNSRDLPEDAKIYKIIIVKKIDGWYANICFKTQLNNIVPNYESQIIGIDWGVARFITLSNGEYKSLPKSLNFYYNKIKYLQKSLNSLKKGSRNYLKKINRIKSTYNKINRIKTDWEHKVTTELIKNYSGFVIEDLDLRSMLKNNKNNYKSSLNNKILKSSPFRFYSYLEYKSNWNSKYFNKVDSKYTSQTCFNCKFCNKSNRISQEKFVCIQCGYNDNADINAAKNILGRDTAIHS